MKILAFAASSSTQSINKKLVSYAASLVNNAEVELLDLNDYEMPIFSQDRENHSGVPDLAHTFLAKISEADALMISFAEHNGTYAVAYKNIFDWCSRVKKEVYQGKPMILLSTSPGPGGAGSVLAAATNSMQFFKGDVKASLSVPSFHDNFDVEKGVVTNEDIDAQLRGAIAGLAN